MAKEVDRPGKSEDLLEKDHMKLVKAPSLNTMSLTTNHQNHHLLHVQFHQLPHRPIHVNSDPLRGPIPQLNLHMVKFNLSAYFYLLANFPSLLKRNLTLTVQ
jgi:hypothetical protein